MATDSSISMVQSALNARKPSSDHSLLTNWPSRGLWRRLTPEKCYSMSCWLRPGDLVSLAGPVATPQYSGYGNLQPATARGSSEADWWEVERDVGRASRRRNVRLADDWQNVGHAAFVQNVQRAFFGRYTAPPAVNVDWLNCFGLHLSRQNREGPNSFERGHWNGLVKSGWRRLFGPNTPGGTKSQRGSGSGGSSWSGQGLGAVHVAVLKGIILVVGFWSRSDADRSGTCWRIPDILVYFISFLWMLELFCCAFPHIWAHRSHLGCDSLPVFSSPDHNVTLFYKE